MATQPIPDGYHSLTPCLAVRGAASPLDLYARAFGIRLPATAPVGPPVIS